MSVSRFDLHEAVVDRLSGMPGVTLYLGEVPDKPPLIQLPDGPDPADRVAPYVVLWGGAGTASDEGDVADELNDLVWPFQTTIAAGYARDCLDVVDRVHDLLNRWTPVVDGLVCGRVAPPPGFDPGLVRRDNDVTPPRSFLALQWRVTATR